METVAEYNNLKIPDWALSYLVNADDSGITEEDKKLVDDYMKFYEDLAEKNDASIIFSIETKELDEVGELIEIKETNEWKEPYFTWSPEFGLGCSVVECTILIVK